MRPFQELGALVETRWRAVDYDEHRLPAIAASALEERALPDRVDPWAAVRHVLSAAELPEQRDVEGRFSDLPITVYNGPRFYVDLYFWLDGTTEIHQHAFAGAFQVLSGSSLHSRYAFDREREINPRLLTGRLQLEDVEILRQGAVRQIAPGPGLIHSLFHLDRPSVTLAVRSQHTPTVAPQYAYWKPCFAFDPFYRETALAKKLQVVSLLLKMGHAQADEMLGALLAEADFHTGFRVLELAAHHLVDAGLASALGLSASTDRMERLLERARARHGELVDLVGPALAERRRQAEISRRRATITHEDHRFLLALLLNVTERSKVIELVAQRQPDADPVETIVDWVEELGTTRHLGAEENALGIAGWDDDHVFVFECLLRGQRVSDLGAEITARYAPTYAAGLAERASAIARKIRSAAVFTATLGE